MTIVRDGLYPGPLQRANGRQFLAGDVFADGARDENIDDTAFVRPFSNQSDCARVINGRRGVRHTNHGREPAPRRRRCAGGNRFLRRLPRLPQMHVQINQAGADDESCHIHPFNISRRLLGGVGGQGGHFALQNQQIGDRIELVGGVDDAAAVEEQRFHARRQDTQIKIDSASVVGNAAPGLRV